MNRKIMYIVSVDVGSIVWEYDFHDLENAKQFAIARDVTCAITRVQESSDNHGNAIKVRTKLLKIFVPKDGE